MKNMQVLLLENLQFVIVMCFVAAQTVAFGGHSWFTAIMKWEGV